MRNIDVGRKVYIAPETVDFRKSINGLAALVQSSFTEDVFGGGLFVFCNGSKDKIKILVWDKDGFILLYKRREKGKFFWPTVPFESKTIAVSGEDLNRLLDGLVMEKFVPKRDYTLI